MLRGQQAPPGRLRARLSYANVTASLALLLALGGTATAAITLPNNSVGSAQIQANAVRSSEIDANAVAAPEIEANAVGSPEIDANAVRGPEIEANAVGGAEIETDAVGNPEIAEGAVRSSEILDETIRLADIAPDAQAALDAPRVRVDTDGGDFVSSCDELLDCPNMASIQLPEGRWLVQARFSIAGEFAGSEFCGLVESDTTVIDFATNVGLGFGTEQVSLMAVLTIPPSDVTTTVAVRCDNESATGSLVMTRVVITGVEVKPLTSE